MQAGTAVSILWFGGSCWNIIALTTFLNLDYQWVRNFCREIMIMAWIHKKHKYVFQDSTRAIVIITIFYDKFCPLNH